MNIKHYFSFFGVSLLLSVASCTSEIEKPMPQPGPGEGENDDPNRREVLIDLKNNLQLKRAATTKAADEDPIATEDENYIHTLDVYVFGSKAEDGNYTFQELHYYRSDASEVTLNGVKSFSFNLAATEKGNTSALLKLNKGLFVKLYVVANRTDLYQTDAAGVLTKYTDFQSLGQEGDIGKETHMVIPGKPTLPDFLKFHTQLINPANAATPTADDILEAPLPMTGAYTTPLDLTDFGTSARTQISFKLSRLVARFDIVNNAATSKFTIEKISMGKGRTGASFFSTKELTRPTGDNLVSYPERTLSALTQQADHTDPNPALNTTSVSKGAFYTWPSPTGDDAYLILKGQYAVNMSQKEQVSYKIPFKQVVNGVGSYIEVQYNHRYTIAITNADDYHLDFTINVANWDETEPDLNYDPDNDFEKGTNIVLTTGANENVGAYVLDDGKVELLPVPGSKFAFKMGSNTKLKEELIFKNGIAWFAIDGVRPPVTKATSMDSVYAYKIIDAALSDISKLQPATIRLTNLASGMRKEIKVVPTPGPVVTFAESTPKNFNVFDPATHTATIYNLGGQTIKLKVAATIRSDRAETPKITTGSTAKVKDGDTWLTSSANVTAAEGEYTLTLGTAPSNDATTTVDFASAIADISSVITQVKVNLKDPKMTKPVEAGYGITANAANKLEMTAGSGGIPKVTLLGVKDNQFTVNVTSPEGVTAVATSAGDWLTVTPADGAKGEIILTGKIANAAGMAVAAKTDGKITITNVLDAADKLEIEVVTSVPARPVVTMTTVAGLSTYVPGTHTATLYNAVNQTITLLTDIATTATSTEGWLTLSPGSTTEHLITLNAATGTPGTTTGTITFTSASGSVQTVTVALADPAITALVAGDVTSTTGTNTLAVAAGPANAKVTMTEAIAASAFTFKVKSKGGISVDNTAVTGTSSWLTVTKTLEEDASGGGKEATFTVTIKAGTVLTAPITDGKIVLANAITGGGNLTIDVVTTVPIIP